MESLIKPETGLIFWTVFIFIALVFVLAKTVWKPLLSAVEAREERIRADIEAAKKARDEAQAFKSEIDERLKKLNLEISEKLAIASKEAAIEKERILEKASSQAQLMIENAKKELENQKIEAAKQLEKKVLEIALLSSKKVLGLVIDKKLDAQLSEALAKELSSGKIKKVNA